MEKYFIKYSYNTEKYYSQYLNTNKNKTTSHCTTLFIYFKWFYESYKLCISRINNSFGKLWVFIRYALIMCIPIYLPLSCIIGIPKNQHCTVVHKVDEKFAWVTLGIDKHHILLASNQPSEMLITSLISPLADRSLWPFKDALQRFKSYLLIWVPGTVLRPHTKQDTKCSFFKKTYIFYS